MLTQYDQSCGLEIFQADLPGTFGGGCNGQYGKSLTMKPGTKLDSFSSIMVAWQTI